MICPICQRELPLKVLEKHHLIPKTFKGTVTVDIHSICHSKLHHTITEREMLNHYNTVERIVENEEIQKFVKWVSKKPDDFCAKNKDTKDRKRKRRR